MISVQLQYIIVFIILACTVAWLIYSLFHRKGKKSTCCGCALADHCNKKQIINKKKGKQNKCEDRK